MTGGKDFSVAPVVLSLMASYLTATTLIGWPVEIYTRGTQLFASLVAGFVSTYVAAEVFIPIYFKINAISINKYLEERFNSKTLVVTTSALMTLSWVSCFSPALAFGVSTGVSTTNCILLTAGVVTIYTTFGGLKAVIWTDVIQLILMIIGLIAIIIKGTLDIGGVGEVLERNSLGGRIELFNFKFNPYMSNNVWTVAFGTSFVYIAAYCTDQLAVQRMCALPNMEKVRRALFYVMIGFFFIEFSVLYLGMVIFAYFYKCDPLKAGQIQRTDEIVTLYVSEIFDNTYPGLLGLFVTCIFCSSLSTLSSGLSALSVLIWEDWLKSLLPKVKPTTNVLITKFLSLLIGIIVLGAAFLAMNIGTIFEAIFILIGAPVGPLFGLFFLGVTFPNVNWKGAITGMGTGFLIAIWITVGAIFNKAPEMVLPTTTDGCNNTSLLANITHSTPFEQLKHSRISSYAPRGLNLVYHISPLFVPVVTFLTTIMVGNIVSFIFGGNEDKEVDEILLCDLVRKVRDYMKALKKNRKSKPSNCEIAKTTHL
ncbi:sodium-coupled monocarboxylate transporter 1-like protein 2 [Dinothrombium tinctorium]|uniref:Sodium-coupled monocarboxylate transporter 1-like protein 2 n=1 Tax=Dinothrombium tinctorium TaxID=1965070 RepID=A0A443RPD2_9ACAR|nr:sodium-coupled monocarboxylate transporter 1-like protein 2 [Dinothrombium tinctorium]